MKNILLYGDSLVYGKVPKLAQRYSAEERFAGILQKKLSDVAEIVVEGLRARTLFGENFISPDRNGLDQFGPIYGSHIPLDLVIIFLGTNDCNKMSDKSEADFVQALQSYLEKISTWRGSLTVANVPKVLLVSPPNINDKGVALDEKMMDIFGVGGEEKTRKLAQIYESFSKENDLLFFDAAKHCEAAADEGIHLDLENNIKLANALEVCIRNIIISL